MAEGISDSALSALVQNAAAQKSDAVVILRNGKLVYENYFGGADSPILAMSASKSFVGLAYGFLLADHRLASLDEHVSTVLPEFANIDPRKAEITYRQLLSQSSGLDPTRFTQSPLNIELHAIASPLVFPPGSGWQYCNQGADLLAALAGRLAGKPMDQYLREKLFTPLGITSVGWDHDARGVPTGAGEMFIRPLDLAKVGQAILDSGTWHGNTVIPADWITASSTPSTSFAPEYGLLWWRFLDNTRVGLTSDLLAQWRWMGASDSTITKLASLAFGSYESASALYAAIAEHLTTPEYSALLQWLSSGDHFPRYRVVITGRSLGFAAIGSLGQYLTIFPDKKIVAVRMRRWVPTDTSAIEVNAYPFFPGDVLHLVP